MRATPYHQSRHLPAESLEDASAACPACGNTRPRDVVCRIQDEPRVDLLECGHCGICSASMMPTAAALEDYYSSYYAAEGDKHTFAEVGRFGRHVARRLEGHFEVLRVLDFGGGDGTLALAVARCALEESRADRVELTIVDSTPARHSEDARITVRSVDELDAVEGRFDLVIASAILEHVPAVGACLKRLFGLCAPGALFYARTPYWAPLAKWTRRVDLTFPGHVHDIGPPFWNHIGATYGIGAVLVASQPSIVETGFGDAPVRTLAAHVLKAPSRLEVAVRPFGWRRPLWGVVGGWEVFLQFPL